MDLYSVNKAIAGGLVSMIVAVAAHYGFHPGGQAVTAIGVLATAVVGYVVGHVVVYLAPRNSN